MAMGKDRQIHTVVATQRRFSTMAHREGQEFSRKAASDMRHGNNIVAEFHRHEATLDEQFAEYRKKDAENYLKRLTR
jgi:hypothetical protein